LKEKIKEDKAAKKIESWTSQQAEEDTNECFGAPRMEKQEERVGEVP
jgi:hypothetical protein